MNASVIFTSVAVAATIAIGPAASADAPATSRSNSWQTSINTVG